MIFLKGLISAEVFNPKTGTWRMIESMSSRRSSVGVGVVSNELYAVGGNIYEQLFKYFHLFNCDFGLSCCRLRRKLSPMLEFVSIQ